MDTGTGHDDIICGNTSQSQSQDSVVFLGEWGSSGAFVENSNHGAEEIINIVGEVAKNLPIRPSLGLGISERNSSQNNNAIEHEMEIIESPAPTAGNETTVLVGSDYVTQQPVWPVTIIPLSNSPRRPRNPVLGQVFRSSTKDPTNIFPEAVETERFVEHLENGIENSRSPSMASIPANLSIHRNRDETTQAIIPGESTSPEISIISCSVPSAAGTSTTQSAIACQTPLKSRNKRLFPRNITRSRTSHTESVKRRKATAGMGASSHNVSPERGSDSVENTGEVEPSSTDTNAQIVSIHSVCLATAKKAFGRRAESYSEFQLIEKIMEKCNYKIKESESEDCRTRSTFQQREEFQMPTISEESKLLFSGDDFRCEIYVQDVSNSNNFLMGYGLQEKESIKNCIVFYHRPGDIFALTTRNAWNAIQWCSDYGFPSLIAARLLNPEGQIKSTEKELTGNVRVTTKTRRTCEGDNPLNLNKISTHYVADFRKNCSIFKFRCFNQNADPNTQEKVRVEVGMAYIRILKRLTPSDLLLILSHLSFVHKGGITNHLNSEEIEKNSNIHTKNLTMVSNELNRTLDSLLVRKIYNAIHNSGKGELDNYDFCHKDVDDFSLADSFHLYVGKEKVSSFSNQPTLRKIIEFIMRSNNIKSFKNLINAEPFEDFERKFTKFKIGYSVKGRDKPPEKILNFVEGDIMHSDGLLYCKYMKKWCLAAPDYFARVHVVFQDTLKKHLITADNFPNVQLRKPWPSKEEISRQKNEDESYDPIKEYVNSYRDEERFYIPELLDDSENVKLFDMLAIGDKGKIFIYIVQDGFSAKLRDASSHIKSALNKMNCSNFGNTNTPTQSQSSESDSLCEVYTTDPLKQFYELSCDDNFFVQRFPDFHQFKSELRTSTIVFAIADPPEDNHNGKRKTINSYFQSTSSNISNPSTLARSLRKERDLPTKLTISDLVDLLQGQEYLTETQLQEFLDIFDVASATAIQSKAFAVARHLYGIFRGMKYVDRDGNVTSKLLLSSQKLFQIEGLENHHELQNAIYNIIKSHHSQFKHLIPKLALGKIKDLVITSGYQFNICEIPCSSCDCVQ